MKYFTVLSLLLAFCFHASAQEFLPKGMTEAEKLIWKEYIENYPTDKGTAPPAATPRTPGEWEEAQGVVITWASYQQVLREIVRYAKDVVKVYIVCSDASAVQSYLAIGGVSTTNVEFVVTSFNSVWVRDYGPQSIYLNGTNQLAIVDWVYNRPRPQDDQVPVAIASHMGLPIYQMTVNPNKLIATGGNFMADGFGKGFSSKLILEENSSLTEPQINAIKYSYMGIAPYVKMNTLPYDGIHHIDMHMKLLDEETLLVGQYPQGVADGPQIEANLAYVLANFQTPYGRPYRVVRIPMPASPSGYYPPASSYYTYTNSVILNGTVLVPQYGLAKDQEALSIYAQAMPGYNIVGINSSSTISASGSIHCITHEIAANDPILIAHPSIREATYSPNGFPVWAYINSASGITSATLHWKLSGQTQFSEVPMSLDRDTFWASIPPQLFNAQVNYYISARNGSGKVISKPLVAPAGFYTFTVAPQGIGFDFTASSSAAQVNDVVTYTYTNMGIAASSYFWNFGEGAVPQTASGIGPHAVAYSTPGSKTVTLTVNGSAILVKEGILTVTENQPTYYSLSVSINGNGETIPKAGLHSFAMGESITLTATPNDGWRFDYWSVNGSNTITPEMVINMSTNIEATAYFSEITGLSTDIPEKIETYPNPVKNTVYLKVPKGLVNFTISILAPTGQRLSTFRVTTSEELHQLDFSRYPAGFYVINVISDDMRWSSRVVKL